MKPLISFTLSLTDKGKYHTELDVIDKYKLGGVLDEYGVHCNKVDNVLNMIDAVNMALHELQNAVSSNNAPVYLHK